MSTKDSKNSKEWQLATELGANCEPPRHRPFQDPAVLKEMDETRVRLLEEAKLLLNNNEENEVD